MRVKRGDRQLFCEAAGLSARLLVFERIPHPTKRCHVLWRAEHPDVGEVLHATELGAWHTFCDLVERQQRLLLKKRRSRCRQ